MAYEFKKPARTKPPRQNRPSRGKSGGPEGPGSGDEGLGGGGGEAKGSKGGRTFQDQAQSLKQLEQYHVDLIDNFVTNTNARDLCDGILSVTDLEEAKLRESLEKRPDSATIREALDHEHNDTARDLFAKSKFAIAPIPGPFDNPQTLDATNWLQQKGARNQNFQERGVEMKEIAKIIERKAKHTGKDKVEHLMAAEKNLNVQASNVQKSVAKPNTAFQAGMQIAWARFDLYDQRAQGKITQEQFQTQQKTLKDDMDLLTIGGPKTPVGTKNLRIAQDQTVKSTLGLLEDDTKRKTLHDLAEKLKRGPINKVDEEKALQILAPKGALVDTYKSKTMTDQEKKEFWTQTENLTKKPLTATAGVKLTALQMKQITRENKEHATALVMNENAPDDQTVLQETESRKRETEQKEKEKKAEKEKKQDKRERAITAVVDNAKNFYEKGSEGMTLG